MNRIITIMAVTAALFATAGNVVRAQEQPDNKVPYHHNFSKDKLKENTDRHLKSITVTTNYGGHYVSIMFLITLINLKSIWTFLPMQQSISRLCHKQKSVLTLIGKAVGCIAICILF